MPDLPLIFNAPRWIGEDVILRWSRLHIYISRPIRMCTRGVIYTPLFPAFIWSSWDGKRCYFESYHAHLLLDISYFKPVVLDIYYFETYPAVDPALWTVGEVTPWGGARHELRPLLLLYVTTDQARLLGALETLHQEGEARESPRKRTQYARVFLKYQAYYVSFQILSYCIYRLKKNLLKRKKNPAQKKISSRI